MFRDTMTAVGLPPRRPIVLLSSLLLLELLHCSHAYQSGGLHNNDLVAFSSTLTVPGLVSTTVCHSKQKTTPPLPILYTNQPHCIEKWLFKEVVSSQSARPVLGLDVESIPTFLQTTPTQRSGPTLLQLATTKAALVVPLQQNDCPLILKTVLQDDSILKVGVGIDQDLLDLRDSIWTDLTVHSRFDLANTRVGSGGHQTPGLQTLCRHNLQLYLPKPKHVTLSNWGLFPLTTLQLEYAARDAWAGAALWEGHIAGQPADTTWRALARYLRHQPSLEELHARQTRRRTAKYLLRMFRQQQQHRSSLPVWKQQLVRELHRIVRSNQRYPPRGISAWATNHTNIYDK